MIVDQLKKYGIDSPDLRAELTDHYAERIEVQMSEGMDFQLAFEAFKASNSWLKLRKLQHLHEEIHTKRFLSYLRQFLREIFFGRISWVTYPVLVMLYFVFDSSYYFSEALLYLLQITSVAIALFTILKIAMSTRKKLIYFQRFLSFAFAQLYLGVYLYLPVLGYGSVGKPMFQDILLATELNVLFYGFWILSLIFTIRIYWRSEQYRLAFHSAGHSS